MTANGLLQIGIFFVVLLALVKPLGGYMAAVYEGRVRLLGPLERVIYRLMGVDPFASMTWRAYAVAILLFNLVGLFVVYAIQRAQGLLPLNPQNLGAVGPELAWNTAVSFATNTNWQSYGGEVTMSNFTQMLALNVQNFVSAAAGMAVLVALIRGLRARQTTDLGNFWADLTRGVLYILLPLSLVLAMLLVSQGVVQSFEPARHVALLQPVAGTDGALIHEQILPLGPAASQIAIKQLGTNGGGFYNVNSAHPFENPTPLSNFLEVLAILLIPAALCYTFGKMIGDTRQGWAVLAAMTVIFVPLLLMALIAEQSGTPMLTAIGVAPGGGNMEGKETRFGIVNSVLWAAATTAASNGSVNSMHASFTPIGGLVPMWLIQLGEVIYGGVGSGLYGLLIFVIIAVFVAGLMVGRTPEYLGKKIEAFEMKMAALVILIPPLLVLAGAALAVMLPVGLSSILNKTPAAHGFSEILYAFSSAGNNNGSAFAGLNANTPFYNIALGITMLIGRYWLAVPVLAIAGSMAGKKHTPTSAGTLPTHTPLFIAMLSSVVIIVGALTFIPALALGPIVEALKP